MKRTSVSTVAITGGKVAGHRRPHLGNGEGPFSSRNKTEHDSESLDNEPGAARCDAYRSDRILVNELLAGDGAAWKRFIETHGRLVRARVADVASAFGRSEDESSIDDATAEVFAALLGNDGAALRAYAGRSSLGTYVAVIATRSATRGFARRTRHAGDRTDLGLAHTKADQNCTDPMNRMIEAEQQQRLQQLLSRLPKKQRSLISMFHLQGKTYAQISEQLEIPIGSIGPTLRRAEARLRLWMEGNE